ncbi:MAG: DUF2867 domain-containing protein [Prevotellaceae bacterium]|jgi:hypothetical protein|nr:DUF2867 domain-containing protein [Prevotellaceae bacterium]
MIRKRTDFIKKDNTPPENSTISADFGTVDYCDSYRIRKITDGDVEAITNQIFKAPKWVNGMMKIRDLFVRPFGLKTARETESDKIFPVIAQTENEIIMGINDRHLNFRVSVLIDREKSYIYVTTLVQYNNRFGNAYFLLIKPFHNLIVRSVMKRLINGSQS